MHCFSSTAISFWQFLNRKWCIVKMSIFLSSKMLIWYKKHFLKCQILQKWQFSDPEVFKSISVSNILLTANELIKVNLKIYFTEIFSEFILQFVHKIIWNNKILHQLWGLWVINLCLPVFDADLPKVIKMYLCLYYVPYRMEKGPCILHTRLVHSVEI